MEKITDKVFHLLTGGLEFIEISAKLKKEVNIEILRPYVNKFSEINNIEIVIVNELPRIIIGKSIFIKYYADSHCIVLKALHSYYDGIAISNFFNELDKLYKGEDVLKEKFKIKTPFKSVALNSMCELGANILMNKMNNEKENENYNIETKPYMVFSNITSGELIRKIQEKENKDMVLLVNKSKVDNESNNKILKNNLTFKYIKKGEDFKTILKSSPLSEQLLRFSKWLIKKEKILFLNNLSNIKLPSYIDYLVCNDMNNKGDDVLIKSLVAYPRTSEGLINVYKGF